MTDCCWILTRDWNYIECAYEKSNIYGVIIIYKEWRIFNLLKYILKIIDDLLDAHTLYYNWDSRWRDGTKVMAQLDWTYIFSFPDTTINNSNYTIMNDNAFSNYLARWKGVHL